MSRPFIFRLHAAELFAQIQPLNNDEKAAFITQFSIDLITLNGTSDYSKAIIADTLKLIESKRENGKKGGRPKTETKAKVKLNKSGTKAKAKQEEELEVKEEIKEKPKDLKPSPLKSQMFEICKAWKAFIEMRKFIRKPLTNYAMDLTCKTLAKLQREGHDPVAVLNKSVEHNWQGVFALEEKTNGNGTARSTGTTGKKTGLVEANGAGTDFLS